MFCGSWGLSLFVLFEPSADADILWTCSWGLSLFVLFEHPAKVAIALTVLED